jgi:hypothetical protein
MGSTMAEGVPTDPAHVIRRATEADGLALLRLAELDCQRPFAGPALVAEFEGVPVAAISVLERRVIADPFERTAEVQELLTMRLAALRRETGTRSLAERPREGTNPFAAARAHPA